MSEQYFQMNANTRIRMPADLVDIMTDIADTVVEKLGELSLVASYADEFPPVQRALLLSGIEKPRFLFKHVRKKHEVLAELPSELLPYEKAMLEERLYERGVTASWYIDPGVQRTWHELHIHYVKSY